MIAQGLEKLAVSVAELVMLPGNPRRGDVDAIARSLAQFGQRKPVVARRADKVVIAGNHTVLAGPFGGEPTGATDVWTYPRDFDPNHSTPKPVDLIVRAIETSSKYGDLVLDCFAGSGSTLIACHKSGRVGRLIEIEPANCDVICRRFQAHTGIVPVRNGVPHDFTE